MIVCRAYAKVNLALAVLGRRRDGYHEILSVFQTIDLHDTVRVTTADNLTLTCSDPALARPHNLALRAAALLRERSGVRAGAAIALVKRIPIAAGLGGGSSDAAATLLALCRLWRVSIARPELAALAAELGSDVPYFLHGGTALVSGRGEGVAPLGEAPTRWLVLLRPNLFLSAKTATLYRRLTPGDYDDGGGTHEAAAAIGRGEFPAEKLLQNTFEKVAYAAFPGLAGARALLHTAGGRVVHLSGAGPTLFSIFDTAEGADAALDATMGALGREGSNGRAWVARTGSWRPVAVNVD